MELIAAIIGLIFMFKYFVDSVDTSLNGKKNKGVKETYSKEHDNGNLYENTRLPCFLCKKPYSRRKLVNQGFEFYHRYHQYPCRYYNISHYTGRDERHFDVCADCFPKLTENTVQDKLCSACTPPIQQIKKI